MYSNSHGLSRFNSQITLGFGHVRIPQVNVSKLLGDIAPGTSISQGRSAYLFNVHLALPLLLPFFLPNFLLNFAILVPFIYSGFHQAHNPSYLYTSGWPC
jgi:hypothetical protein